MKNESVEMNNQIWYNKIAQKKIVDRWMLGQSDEVEYGNEWKVHKNNELSCAAEKFYILYKACWNLSDVR